MKASELMLNDWVQHKGSPYRVCMITDIGVVTADDGICHFHFISKYLSPIPLTEEILVKNGFVYREAEETCATVAYHHWQLDGHWFPLNYTQYFRKEKRDDMPRFDVDGIAIHHVHQLQHLLRLCGIEKEIEL